jgi:hypothetical protein
MKHGRIATKRPRAICLFEPGYLLQRNSDLATVAADLYATFMEVNLWRAKTVDKNAENHDDDAQ